MTVVIFLSGAAVAFLGFFMGSAVAIASRDKSTKVDDDG